VARVNKVLLYHYLIDQGRKPDADAGAIEIDLDGVMCALDIWYKENGRSEFFTVNHHDSIENLIEYAFEYGRSYDR